MNILVVDDEKEIADVIALYLQSDQYTVYPFYTGEEALECMKTTKIDLAILDVMLPGIDGFEILKKIRERYTFPVIMLTAKTEYIDKITGLTLGADDYISKPFDPAELVARVNANLRQYERMKQKIVPTSEESPEEIRVHDLRILVNSWKVYKGDREIKFPNREFELLKFFAMNPNIVFSKEQLFEDR